MVTLLFFCLTPPPPPPPHHHHHHPRVTLYGHSTIDRVTLMYNSFNKEGGLQESNKLHTTSPKAGPKDRPSDNLYRDGILYSTGTGGNYRR